ncbi:FkbM family methyltransferase [Sphingopyxis sp. KK2]|uniref:FkbM family methyltransferase n=1 Tax=Sphingopyxis sp. KK2 TaxID=1855727 RepID=UPI00097E5A1F|nr:FkbM family methyltransferase [Sphingopyxis sp. KK2]
MSMEISPDSRLANRILRRLGQFSRFNRQIDAMVGGVPVAVPVSAGLMAELTEPWMHALLRRLLANATGTFIDVGVNLGQTLIKVKAIEPARRYIGFEPNPACVHYVEELVAANGWTDVRVVPAGLGPRSGIVTLELYHGRSGDSAASIVEGFRPDKVVTFRKTVAILGVADLPDDLLAAPVGLVKIDVEGAEADVIDALTPVIARDRPQISMEILPCYDGRHAERIARQARIEARFADLDYRLLRVLHEGRDGDYELVPIDAIGIHGDLSLCEYVACPAERVGEFLAA